MSRLTLAAAQIECRPGDVPSNLATHLAVVARARAADVDLVVFPELSLTDYLGDPDCRALGLPREASALLRLAEAAGPMAVSVGFIERAADGRCYNAQALLAGGGVCAVHRKLNLPGYGRLREDRVYAAGDRLAVEPLPVGGRAATLICADAWNPALPWLAALGGADLLLLPAASARGAVGDDFDNPGGWEVNLRHTALTYGLPTVFANHCGTRAGFAFWGGSRILDAAGRDLGRAGSEPDLIIAEVDLADGIAARARLPTIRDSDPALVHRLLGACLSSRSGA